LLLDLLTVAAQSLGLGLITRFPLAAPLLLCLSFYSERTRMGTTMKKEVSQEYTSALQNTIQLGTLQESTRSDAWPYVNLLVFLNFLN